MGVLRGPGVLPRVRRHVDAVRPARHHFSGLIVAFALLLCGCVSGPFVRPGDSNLCPCAGPTQAESGTNSDQPKNGQAEASEKSNKPRTLPQALRAYCRCVRTHGYSSQEEAE